MLALENHKASSSRPTTKLVPAVLEEYTSTTNDFRCDSSYDIQPDNIDDPWPYVFQRGDNVWIKLCGKWHPGRIWGNKVLKGLTHDRKTMGFYFCVYFWGKARKFVSPLNGEVKPNTAHVRRLLKDSGLTT